MTPSAPVSCCAMGDQAGIGALRDEVLGFRYRSYRLESDLEHAVNVRGVRAPEATILYCARILEALAAAALESVGVEPSSHVFANLSQLKDFNLLPRATECWAHSLRRLGNDARHLLRRVAQVDAELALLLAERWIDWFFRERKNGPRLDSLRTDGRALALAEDAELRPIIEELERFAATDREDASIDESKTRERPQFFLAPLLPAVLGEIWINRKLSGRARALLTEALDAFPGDLRLRQLMGLAWSRDGEIEQALEWLEPLVADRELNDPETAGILSGVYKRLWTVSGDDSYLAKTNRMYRDAYKRSRRTNAYLGINAAATSMWLGRCGEADGLAGEGCDLLLKRRSAAKEKLGEGILGLDDWDKLTLAEAHFLRGEFAEARLAYADRDFDQGMREIADRQLDLHLGQMGIPVSAREFRAVAAGDRRETLVVGVTGHRRMRGVDARRAEVRTRLEELRDGRRIVVLSALAEGADRMVVHLAREIDPAAGLRVALPLEITDYLRDFATPGSRDEFLRLLAGAERFQVVRGDRDHARDAAYERVGRRIVERCDLLLALWDGRESRGRGGTAEIVRYARDQGRQVEVIETPRN